MGEEIKSLKDLDRVIPFRKALLASLGLRDASPGAGEETNGEGD